MPRTETRPGAPPRPAAGQRPVMSDRSLRWQTLAAAAVAANPKPLAPGPSPGADSEPTQPLPFRSSGLPGPPRLGRGPNTDSEGRPAAAIELSLGPSRRRSGTRPGADGGRPAGDNPPRNQRRGMRPSSGSESESAAAAAAAAAGRRRGGQEHVALEPAPFLLALREGEGEGDFRLGIGMPCPSRYVLAGGWPVG
jgi:hypothetical protein